MRYLISLALLLQLCSCGVFDNPLHLPVWAGHPADTDAIGQEGQPADEQAVEQPQEDEEEDRAG